MKIKAFVVIDTNVLISAMLQKTGMPKTIFDLVQQGNLIPIFDKRMLKEYYAVVHYDKFQNSKHLITEETIKNTFYTIIKNGILIKDVATIAQDLHDLMPDKDDIPFFEVKESSQEFDSMLVTGNKSHYPFPDDRYIVTPNVLVALLSQMDRFVQMDFAYEEVIDKLTKTNLQTEKYQSGDELLTEIFEDFENKTIRQSYFYGE